MPHHVTQQGAGGADVFYSDQDRREYLTRIDEYARRYGVAIWAYCLMSDHVNFVAVPRRADSLSRTFREAHRAYASWMNRMVGESGHLWQERFHSCVLHGSYLPAAVRYVERGPVRAGLLRRAERWKWSSAAAHCGLRDDPLLSPIEMPWPRADWAAYLREDDEAEVAALAQRTRTGRPWGPVSFLKRLEKKLGLPILPRKRGRKPKQAQQ